MFYLNLNTWILEKNKYDIYSLTQIKLNALDFVS